MKIKDFIKTQPSTLTNILKLSLNPSSNCQNWSRFRSWIIFTHFNVSRKCQKLKFFIKFFFSLEKISTILKKMSYICGLLTRFQNGRSIVSSDFHRVQTVNHQPDPRISADVVQRHVQRLLGHRVRPVVDKYCSRGVRKNVQCILNQSLAKSKCSKHVSLSVLYCSNRISTKTKLETK